MSFLQRAALLDDTPNPFSPGDTAKANHKSQIYAVTTKVNQYEGVVIEINGSLIQLETTVCSVKGHIGDRFWVEHSCFDLVQNLSKDELYLKALLK